MKQKEVWRVDYLGPWNGGVLTTAGNLVVQGDAAGQLQRVPGRLRARSCGRCRRQTRRDGRPGHLRSQWRAIHRRDGRLGWRHSRCWQGKEAAQSGNLRNVSRVLVFKVGGNSDAPAAASRGEARAQPAASTADPATIAAGEQLFGAVLRRVPRRNRGRRRRGSRPARFELPRQRLLVRDRAQRRDEGRRHGAVQDACSITKMRRPSEPMSSSAPTRTVRKRARVTNRCRVLDRAATVIIGLRAR